MIFDSCWLNSEKYPWGQYLQRALLRLPTRLSAENFSLSLLLRFN
jgi:hypothetical protein